MAAPLGDTENLSFSLNFSLSLPFSVSPEIPCLFSFSLGLLRDWWLCTRESETLYFSLFSFFSSFSFSLVFSPLLFLILFLTEVGFGFLRDWSSGPRERVFLSLYFWRPAFATLFIPCTLIRGNSPADCDAEKN